MILINNIVAPLDATLEDVAYLGAKSVGIDQKRMLSVSWAKKAVDARRKSHIHLVCSIRCVLNNENDLPSHKDIVPLSAFAPYNLSGVSSDERPVIVGSGPAGMLAGLALAEAHLRPIILERGRDVDRRRSDVNTLWQKGVLDPVSNVQFGEGGAGTFSDGKLMTGIRKDLYVDKVLDEFVKAGAPDEIMYLAKPHIGTDKLVNMVKNIRRKIESLGGEYRFEHRLTDLICDDDSHLKGIRVSSSEGEEEIPCRHLILAIGHSARDTFEMLLKAQVRMMQKPFSVGARIEHRQSLINQAQYGAHLPNLGAADYKMAVHLPNGRSAYTFCMCPGGKVVAAASEIGRIATNGMSEYARNAENANAALLVGVDERDFGSDHPLAGMYFQRRIEETAFHVAGNTYNAPAQRVEDFLAHRPSKRGGDVIPSYAPKVCWNTLDSVLPEVLTETMRAAIGLMDRKLHGFSTPDAVLTGPETRSSSPVRLWRDETFQSNIRGLYPCGEGAGYAGGITSAAVDGLKCAEALVQDLTANVKI